MVAVCLVGVGVGILCVIATNGKMAYNRPFASLRVDERRCRLERRPTSPMTCSGRDPRARTSPSRSERSAAGLLQAPMRRALHRSRSRSGSDRSSSTCSWSLPRTRAPSDTIRALRLRADRDRHPSSAQTCSRVAASQPPISISKAPAPMVPVQRHLARRGTKAQWGRCSASACRQGSALPSGRVQYGLPTH